MPVEYKDYYESLGVARTASQEDIRKSFRKLARQYHPDVAKNKATAEEKFKEINEAYEVLGDPEKRKKYDALGANWKQGAEFRRPPEWGAREARPAGGAAGDSGDFEFQFGGTGFSDFFEQLFGARGGRGGADRQHAFSEADFSQPGQDIEGDIMVALEEALHGSVRPISLKRTVPCEECHGTGHGHKQVCPVCGGAGVVTRTEKYQVKVPPGVREEQRLRLAGHGGVGTGRGPAGDLFLRVRLAKHPDFRADNGNLYYDLDVAPWEAVLGASLSVPTLEGRIKIKIPPGTQNGQHLRIRSQGLPQRGGGRGDLLVVVNLQVPKEVSDGERALWEQLGRESRFQPRD
ncbi:MAG: DnaJ C-terminal domain-containing protein [Limisphaerales bacterium]